MERDDDQVRSPYQTHIISTEKIFIHLIIVYIPSGFLCLLSAKWRQSQPNLAFFGDIESFFTDFLWSAFILSLDGLPRLLVNFSLILLFTEGIFD